MSLVEELHRNHQQRRRDWESKAVSDPGINMKNGRTVKPKPEPEPKIEAPSIPEPKPIKRLWFQMLPDDAPESKIVYPKVDDIQRAVCRRCGIVMNDLLSHRRTKDVTIKRQIAVYLSKTLTLRSLPDLGRRFFRDHTTILFAVRKIQKVVDEKSDPDIVQIIEELTEELKPREVWERT